MNTAQLAYRSFCQQAPGSVYTDPRWLDAVSTTAGWDAVFARDSAGQVVAALPLPRLQKGPFGMIDQPRGTHYLGARFLPQLSPTDKAQAWEKLVQQIPQVDYFFQTLPPHTDYLPLAQTGYELLAQYTHVLPLTAGEQAIWTQLKPTLRTQIRKAQKQLRIEPLASPQLFYEMQCRTLAHQGVPQLMPQATFLRIFQEMADALQAWQATDAAGNVHAVIALLANGTQAQLWASAHEAQLRSYAGSSLVYWHAVQAACTQGFQLLDFEGSMQPSVARFYRTFGAQPVPFFSARKVHSPLLRWWRFLRQRL